MEGEGRETFSSHEQEFLEDFIFQDTIFFQTLKIQAKFKKGLQDQTRYHRQCLPVY